MSQVIGSVNFLFYQTVYPVDQSLAYNDLRFCVLIDINYHLDMNQTILPYQAGSCTTW